MKEIIAFICIPILILSIFSYLYSKSGSDILSREYKDTSIYKKIKFTFIKLNDLIISFSLILVLLFFTIFIHKFNITRFTTKEKENFEYVIKLIKYLFGILFASAVLIQVLNFTRQEKHDIVESYSILSKDFLDETIRIFIKNPDMKYFFMDLMGLEYISENTNRDIEKEIELSMLIFSRFAKIAVFEEHTYSEIARKWIHEFLGKSFNTFMRSPTFRGYWPIYKEKLAGPALMDYVHFYYKI